MWEVRIYICSGVAVDSAGSQIYFTDWVDSVVCKVDAKTGAITIVAGNGIKRYTGDGGAATVALQLVGHRQGSSMLIVIQRRNWR